MHADTLRRKRSGVLALVVAVASLLAACTSVPTAGPIEQGGPIDDDADNGVVRCIPRPPASGLAPDAVVRGFLLAAACSAPDAASVAREYIAPELRSTWAPPPAIEVYEAAGLEVQSDNAGVVVSAPLVASLDDAGARTVLASGSRLQERFGVERVGGEWRITRYPDRSLLSRTDLGRDYRSYDLYFLDPTFSLVVPDPVTVLATPSGDATALVRALLRGPSKALAPAVRTAVPEGARLELDTVTVENGVARVQLDAQVQRLDDDSRRALSAQLVWTLRQVPAVTAVAITAGGQPLAVPGVGAEQPLDAWDDLDPDAPANPAGPPALYALAEGRVVRVAEDGTQTPVVGPLGTAAGAWRALAVDAGATQGAVVSANLRQVRVAPLGAAGVARKVFTGTSVSSPAFDRSGALWLISAGAPWRIATREGVQGEQPAVGKVAVEGRGGELEALALAPDGTRAALLERRDGRVVLWVASVSERGGLTGLRRVENTFTDVDDVAWLDSRRLAVAARVGTEPTHVSVVSLTDGEVVDQSGPSDVGAVAADASGVIVVAVPPPPGSGAGAGSNGLLWRGVAGSWEALGPGSEPAFPA